MEIPHGLFITALTLIQLLSVILFQKGFFPIKKSLSGQASGRDPPIELLTGSTVAPPSVQFDKLIVILIDALRYDFVFNKKSQPTFMPYTAKLLERGQAVGYTALAHPPTVTMPRIKALTTGTIPGFIDVVLNFNSQSLQEDHILGQFKQAGKHLIFYGDDTWTKLFPEHFTRYEGTTSFFVSDYTEVDNNVTRHLDNELEQHDWDVMVLHYLGLDHIGHLAGPSSPLMPAKLLEMDKIIQRIHQSIQNTSKETGRSLMVVLGDHGMSDQGNHGGSSHNEMATPMVFIDSSTNTKKPRYKDNPGEVIIDQIDLVPSLALLFGLPIPQNSLGQVISGLFTSLNITEQLTAHLINCHQILNVYQQNVPNYNSTSGYRLYGQAIQYHQAWLRNMQDGHLPVDETNQANKIMDKYHIAMETMRGQIIRKMSNYDIPAMVIGILLMWLVLLGVIYGIVWSSNSPFVLGLPTKLPTALAVICGVEAIMCHMILCTSSYHSNSVCPSSGLGMAGLELAILIISVTSTLVIFSLVKLFLHTVSSMTVELSFLSCILWLGTILHTSTLLSSSFVEEEHQTWYFFTTTLHLAILLKLVFSVLEHKYPKSSIQLPAITSYSQSNTTGENDDNLPLRRVRSQSMYHQTEVNGLESPPLFMKSSLHTVTSLPRVMKSSLRTVTSLTPTPKKKVHFADGVKANVTFTSVLSTIVLLSCHRLLRSINQTGNKWLHLADVSDWLIRPENKGYLSLSVFLSLVLILWLQTSRYHNILSIVFSLVCSVGIYCHRTATGSLWLPWLYKNKIHHGTLEAQTVYFTLLTYILHMVLKHIRDIQQQKESQDLDHKKSRFDTFSSYCLAKDVLVIWTMLVCLLLRPHNIPVMAGNVLQHYVLTKHILPILSLNTCDITLLFVWMGQAAFFYQGNSNSISTIDIAAGYVGIADYSPVLIGVLMGCATYAGPIFWLLALLGHLQQYTGTRRNVKACYTLLLTRCLPLAVYFIMVTIERYHLFVWTVFSPKLLYEAVLTLVVSVIVLVGAMM